MGSFAAPSAKGVEKFYHTHLFTAAPDQLPVDQWRINLNHIVRDATPKGTSAPAGIVNLRYKSCLEMAGQVQSISPPLSHKSTE